ncbi:MAG: NAD(+)/NADH kinase [Elusimicrobium sp.]|jgi:NAD+ kinase|nr:NAD(+)/NADH kinase [Elusimicrobium sp.]
MLIFKNIALYYNKEKPHNRAVAETVAKFLAGEGANALVYDDCGGITQENTDLVITVGGDGTVLNAGRNIVHKKIKLFGLNAGNLGFLTGADLSDYKEILNQVIRGRYSGQDISLLSVSIFKDGKYTVKEQAAFNDCVIKTGGARAFTLEMSLDGKQEHKYFGDGIIASTPTGSTAYSLAAGGPVIAPEVDVILLTPICPHSLTQRPLVLQGSAQILLTPRYKRDGDYATVNIDGQITYIVESGDSVLISTGRHKIKLLQAEGNDFLKTLNSKLKWGNR